MVYASARPRTSEILAIGGLNTAEMILPTVPRVASIDSSLNDDVAYVLYVPTVELSNSLQERGQGMKT